MKRRIKAAARRIPVLFDEFVKSERSGGFVLVACAVISIIVANTTLGSTYVQLFHSQLAVRSIEYWINDGLMTIFFLLVGLELRREVLVGELSSPQKAALPVIAAIGGMLIPAAIFLILNHDLPTKRGAGIPMATDIAFAVGVISLLGSRIPRSLVVLLLAIAVIDDLGSILIIAIFYSGPIGLVYLLSAAALFVSLVILNRLRVQNIVVYLIGGLGLWYLVSRSGIHPTLAGVLLALTIPFKRKGTSLAGVLQHRLHKPVAFLILPLFALANTAITIDEQVLENVVHNNSIGIVMGLVLGKPVGITLFAFVSVTLGLCALPANLHWRYVVGAGMIAGIGFTMSIFITLLAFDESELIAQSKLAILIASVLSGFAGYFWLTAMSPTGNPRKG